MFVHHVQLDPVRHRRIGVFFAPDPVYGGAQTEFNIETYLMLARGTKLIRRPNRALTGGLLGRLAIKSELDGVPRMLPEAISALWQGGEIPAEALPEMLHRLGPEFRKPRDFEPALGQSRAWNWLAAIGAVVLAACLLAGVGFGLFGQRLFGPPPESIPYVQTTGPAWLAQPMRALSYVVTNDHAPALATAELPAGYWPPAGRFAPPPAPGGDRNPPGFTLARVQASGEQRLVLLSAYERTLLPRVFLRGEVVPLTELALPAETLARVGAGEREVNTTFVLCQNVRIIPRRGHGRDFFLMLWILPTIAAIFALPLALVAFIRAGRRRQRRRQVRELRQRLGLPEPAPGKAALVNGSVSRT